MKIFRCMNCCMNNRFHEFFYFYFNIIANLQLFVKRKPAFIMDGIPKIAKEDKKLTVIDEELEIDEEEKSELADNVPNWIAKAYGSKSDKKSFYDPRKLVSLQNS